MLTDQEVRAILDAFPEGLAEDWDEVTMRAFEDGDEAIDAVFGHGLLFPLQRRREFDKMMAAARLVQPQTLLYAGTDKGGGLWCFLKALPTVTQAVACDPRGFPFRAAFERHFPAVDFLWLEMRAESSWTVSEVRRWLDGRGLDLAFIDGGSSALAFWHHVQHMGRPSMFLIHDICDEGPSMDFNHVLHKQLEGRQPVSAWEIVDISESVEAMERFGLGLEPETSHEAWLREWNGASSGVGVVHLEKRT